MIRGFVIHLERASARRANAEKLVTAATCPSEIIPACDGSALLSDTKSMLLSSNPLFKPTYPHHLSNGEIGCFESHKAVWLKMQDENIDAALILEDDVEIIAPEFEAAFDLAARLVEKLGYIQFQVRPIKGATETVAEDGTVQIVKPLVAQLRTSAQLVSIGAAQKLLETSEQIDRPVDAFLQLSWETGVIPHAVIPSGVRDLTQTSGGSTVSKKRSLPEKAWAELVRMVYRQQIGALSRLHKK